MKLTRAKGSLWATLALTGLALVTSSCGDEGDEGTGGGKGGSTSTGGSAGSSGATTGGSVTGGTTTGGTAGTGAGGSAGAGAGPTGGSAGATTGGSGGAGAGGMAGAGGAGAGGMAGAGGAGAGGMAGAGAGGMAGAGGAGAGGMAGAGAGAGGMAGAGAGGMAGAGAGGMAGAGAGAGGMAGAGAGGMAGAGAGGMAGAGAGGMAGAAGMAGAGGAGGVAPTMLYDFEPGVQGWGGGAATQSNEQYFDGANSLKITHGALDNANVYVNASGANLWPGTVLTFHAWLPLGWDTTGASYFQAIVQGNNYVLFDSAGNSARTPMPGGWTTWTYTVPNTFPGGFQTLGFQFGDNTGGPTIPAGAVYIDAISATGGVQNCAVGTGVGAHGFEGTFDTAVYQKDGTDADTTHAQSMDVANAGTYSWEVSFTALPAPSSGSTSRRVFINSPNVYCGQMVTVRVFLPTGSDGLTFQVFSQYNNYAQFNANGPVSVTRNAWNSYTYMLPGDVGPGGIQRLGVQLLWSGTTAFTGSAYIDDITW